MHFYFMVVGNGPLLMVMYKRKFNRLLRVNMQIYASTFVSNFRKFGSVPD